MAMAPTLRGCGPSLAGLTPAGVVGRLAEDRPLTADEMQMVEAILDHYEEPNNWRERRVRDGLDEFKTNPEAGAFLKEEDVQKGMSGYWTRNALNYLLKGRNLTADQKARAFTRFADVIRARTAKWYQPWQMDEIRNANGDVAFLGSLHCLVILNEPKARIFKGIRPTRDPDTGKAIAASDRYFKTWDPRKFVDVEIFEATDAPVGGEE